MWSSEATWVVGLIVCALCLACYATGYKHGAEDSGDFA